MRTGDLMVKCPSCDTDNVGDANFCVKCGAAVGPEAAGWFSEDFNQMARDFAKDMERFGKDAARRAEEFTRELGSELDRMFRGRSVCPQCGSSWPGVHDYCAKCGSKIR